MADSRYAQFASSDPAGPDAAFWEQKVYFDGVPRRRREIVPTLAHTPGMNQATARFVLLGAKIVGDEPLACPPLAWFAEDKKGDFDPDGRWITISGNHVHIDKEGAIDAGGPPAVREAAARRNSRADAATPPPAATPPAVGNANTYRPGKPPTTTVRGIVSGLKTANARSEKFDWLGSIAATGVVSNGVYLAKLPPSGKDRDALIKASTDYAANRPANGPTAVPQHADIIKDFARDTESVPAQFAGHRSKADEEALGSDFRPRSLVKDSRGRAMVVATEMVAPVVKLWPDATMHIATRKPVVGSDDRRYLVFKHRGEVVGIVMGLIDDKAASAKVAEFGKIVPTLAATPGLTERAARVLLLHAPVAEGQPAAKPPAAWFTTGVIPTPGGAHLEDEEEDDDLDDGDDKGPQHNHLPIIGSS